MARNRQGELYFKSWGGRRKGAGRKPTGTRIGALHRARPEQKERHPVLASWSVLPHVWNLRARRCFRALVSAFSAGAKRDDFRLVHFSVQGNHIHGLVEAHSKRALTNGLRALGIRIAHALNPVMARRGQVLGRYHARALKSPREVRDALVYLFHNEKKHAVQYGKPLPRGYVDPCTSAVWFDGWTSDSHWRIQSALGEPTGPRPVDRPWTWLLKTGWRRHGLISIHEMPRVGGARSAAGQSRAEA
jgi:REP element-mobilizing transposase RayT